MKVISLNFETGDVDILSIPDDVLEYIDLEEYIEDEMKYSLSNCEWMSVKSSFKINFIE
jgi:hypothetical protein